MSNWTEEDYTALMRERGQTAFKEAEKAAPKSKYRNVKVVIDGEKFDSKREAQYWAELKLRQQANEIHSLRRQVPFDLMVHGDDGLAYVGATYLADFVFYLTRDAKLCVQDIKGQKETQIFSLKRKWLFLQSGIEVEVVR